MKRTNKGFTLVELIIVIAVIGVLAAILIPVFSNVIKKANVKSAFSDARNALSQYIADKSTGDGAQVVESGDVFVVTKTSGTYYFQYNGTGLVEGANPETQITTGSAYDTTGTTVPAHVAIYHHA